MGGFTIKTFYIKEKDSTRIYTVKLIDVQKDIVIITDYGGETWEMPLSTMVDLYELKYIHRTDVEHG